jgi:4-carboxymuconolactone decarboxylase
MNTKNQNQIFPRGDQGSADYFTGTAWVKILVPKDETGTYGIGNVVFEAGCRNNWHTHAHGQILLVIDGKGFYQERGEAARPLAKGDVVVIPSNVEHWHGAAHDSSFTHIVITNNSAEGPVKWLNRVTNEEYDSLKAESPEPVSIQLTEAAIRNHEQLLPNHESKLQKTDPEFIALFDNFAFDEVIAHDYLDVKTRVTLILASTIGSNALTEYKVMIGGALNVGVTPVAIKEVLYQAVPYVGVARALDFLLATNEVLLERGIVLPLEGQSTTTPETRYDKGLTVQKSIFGEAIDKMYQDAPEDQMHLQKYLSDNCFGDYYTRTGLDIKTRELVTFSVLIALGGVESQVKGHVQGNLNVGNDRQTLINVTTQLLPYIGYPRTLNAIKCINEVTGS